MDEFYTALYDFASPEYDEAVALRTEVLRKPLNLEFTEEQLALEYEDRHFGLWGNDGLYATLILSDKGSGEIKMRQVAVHPLKQGLGLGSRLVKFSEAWAAANGYKKMVLNARDTAVQFYLNLGYKTVGEEFFEVGIPHMKMEKDL